MPTPPGMTELTDQQSWELLRSHAIDGVGRIAVSIMNHPDVFPVNYAVDETAAGPSVVFRTAEGTKLAAAVLGAAVAFEVDGYEPERGEAWSVVVKGSAVEVDTILDRFDPDALPLFPWHAAPKHRVVRVEPTEVTGRRFEVVEAHRPVR